MQSDKMDIRKANKTINIVNSKRKENLKRLQLVKPIKHIKGELVEPKKTLWQRIKLFFSWSK